MKFTLIKPYMCRGEMFHFYRIYDHIPSEEELPSGVYLDDELFTIVWNKENIVVKWLVLSYTDSGCMDIFRDFREEDYKWYMTDELTVEESMKL